MCRPMHQIKENNDEHTGNDDTEPPPLQSKMTVNSGNCFSCEMISSSLPGGEHSLALSAQNGLL